MSYTYIYERRDEGNRGCSIGPVAHKATRSREPKKRLGFLVLILHFLLEYEDRGRRNVRNEHNTPQRRQGARR